MKARQRSKEGFSATELMMGLVVMGLLAVVSVPSYSRFMQSWRLNTEASQMAAVLRLARNAAVSKNLDSIFVIDTDNNTYYYIEDADGNGQLDIGEYKSGTSEFGAGIHFEAYTIPQTWITFGPKGNTEDGGRISLGNNYNGTRTIRVFNGTGNVEVE